MQENIWSEIFIFCNILSSTHLNCGSGFVFGHDSHFILVFTVVFFAHFSSFIQLFCFAVSGFSIYPNVGCGN